jgi:diguanylate cyclase (GGDEF)-like protein
MGILIVEDSPDMAFSLKALLEAEGFKDVHTAGSARQAFRLLGLEGGDGPPSHIDVILMDVRMPGVSGIDACRQIKAQKHLADIPILMVTGAVDEADLEVAFAAGAADYITKPIKYPELLARLRSALALKRELDDRKARAHELLDMARQLREANAALERLSILDELTGVANRRHFNRTLDQEWSRTLRNRPFLSLLLVDVDCFKAYNDTYGHQAGDECLRRVAEAVRGVLKRPTDLLARYGGEEFAVILPDTKAEGAAALAEAIRHAVEALNLPHSRSVVGDRITISLGVATGDTVWPRDSRELISAADQALYQAKHEGRNRVKVFEGPPPVAPDAEGRHG